MEDEQEQMGTDGKMHRNNRIEFSYRANGLYRSISCVTDGLTTTIWQTFR